MNDDKVEIQIRSSLPGRLRIEVAGLKRNSLLADDLVQSLMAQSFIRKVQANPATGRLLVQYEPRMSSSLIAEHVQEICRRKNGREEASEVTALEFGDMHMSSAEVAVALSTEAELDLLKRPQSPAQIQRIRGDPAGLPWHNLSKSKVIDLVESNADHGLTFEEAARRLSIIGPNRLTQAEKPSWLKLFISQFKDHQIQVLLGAVGISAILGRIIDALTTLSIVLVNAVIGVMQELRAEKSAETLEKLSAPTAKVIRQGSELEIQAEELVQGDIVLLEAGDKIPADCRLLEAFSLEVEEASLTGESAAVKKNHKKLESAEISLADRTNMLYMGTIVTRGRAKAIVVATGMSTEMGKIACLMQNADKERTPLQVRLEELAKKVVIACLILSAGIVAVGVLRGMGLLNMFMTGITLAVAAIPEGLSAFVIVAMALGMQRMFKRNIIARSMNALETLGCTTVICSDKTGTLTKNEMTVRALYTCDGQWEVTGEGFAPVGEIVPVDAGAKESKLPIHLLAVATACNNALLVEEKHEGKTTWGIKGDPTEAALLAAAAKAGIWRNTMNQELPRVDEIPFESDKKRMSTVCFDQGRKVVLTKGAVDEVLKLCTHTVKAEQISELGLNERTEIIEANTRMAQNALRVLAIAYRYLGEDEEIVDEKINNNLIFAGLIGMIDPPRPEAKEAVDRCHRAGVNVIMITGDHPKTAQAVAAELGILKTGDRLLTGMELDQLSDQELSRIIGKVRVFARTTPQHKLRIVKTLKRQGYVVAMTGDGVNDAPAVKEADIGIAMGKAGTEVTKEASALILTDDNFATIVAAMEEGRNIYANIRKSVRYLLATNVGEVIVMFLAVLLGMPLPLLPAQILWMNLIGDGLPALALAADPPSKDMMHKPPRPKEESLFAKNLGKKILTRGCLIGVGSLAVYMSGLAAGNLMLARTLALSTLVVSQLFHVFDCRGEETANPGMSNKFLLWAVGSSIFLLVGAIYNSTLQRVFGFQPLRLSHWLMILGINSIIALLDKGLSKLYGPLAQRRIAFSN